MTAFDNIIPYNADGNDHDHSYKISTEDSIECPFCFTHIDIKHMRGVIWQNHGLQLFLVCKRCKNSFIGYTEYRGDRFHIFNLSKGNRKVTNFGDNINKLSSNFVKIYGQSEIAEHEKLIDICGSGYRKALEFLIKDFLIKKYPKQLNEITEKQLGTCINEHIESTQIKEIAKRASWLGNDETHYFRRWGDKDLKDLKTLINITVHFISMDLESAKYMEEMKYETKT